ncbi:MAG: serine/threonine protein kinase, partial [Gemmataceae bacterium]|nr:serine/threonine protein kinase [Gemmataceae bacterium]
MPSHGSCSRCSRPLAVESADGLCPNCRVATGLPATTPLGRHPFAPHPPTGSDPGHFDLADLPLPPDFLLTPPGATRTGPAGVATQPDRAVREHEYLPPAPPGYELVRRLGRGGMGSVFLALELAPQRTVAIKFLNAPSAPGAFVRFLAEVRALARLNHPHIVKVLAVETNWREPFFTMEYVPGGTLADLVAGGAPPVPPAEAARLMLAAAEAVAAAHAADVVHRDLKPSNILLTVESRKVEGHKVGDGPDFTTLRHADFTTATPKVSDFGLAKRTDLDEDLTKTGPIGTAAYMSPEAARGRHREVGVAADVYGLGATLYHLLAGRPPFRGRDRDDTMARVVRDPPARLRAVRPDVPPGLEAVVVRAMEKDPARRYRTAGEFAADLRLFLAGQEPTARPLTPGRRAARWLGRHRRRIAAA